MINMIRGLLIDMENKGSQLLIMLKGGKLIKLIIMMNQILIFIIRLENLLTIYEWFDDLINIHVYANGGGVTKNNVVAFLTSSLSSS